MNSRFEFVPFGPPVKVNKFACPSISAYQSVPQLKVPLPERNVHVATVTRRVHIVEYLLSVSYYSHDKTVVIKCLKVVALPDDIPCEFVCRQGDIYPVLNVNLVTVIDMD